jgi:hypothetical protein
MGRINFARVLIGGFIAGIIINASEFVLNTYVVAEQNTAALAALNKPPIDPSIVIWFVLFSFGFGFILVWTYAAIRPRFGAGVKTAICASALCWGLGYLFPNLFFIVMNLFPRNLIILTTAWGLVEVVIAGIAGAWAYTEM